MAARPGFYRLPFDPIMEIASSGIQALGQQIQYRVDMREFIEHLLEELSAKIWDTEATSAIDRAVLYLQQRTVPEDYARPFCHQVLDTIWMTVVSHFPQLTFQELAKARYVLEPDNISLLVEIKP